MTFYEPKTDAPRETISRALKGLRGLAGITAKELADRSGIPLATIQSIESGRRPLSPFQVAMISAATGASPRYLARAELREWDEETPYSPSSLNRWLGIGQFRQKNEWIADLKKVREEQDQFCKSLSRDELKIYVMFVHANFEMEQSQTAFTESTAGIQYWKAIQSANPADGGKE